MSRLKRAIAQWLCPGVFRDAERWHYVQGRLSELDHWCSVDVPVVGKAARWALASVYRAFMSSDDYWRLTRDQKLALPEPINVFRRELRRDAGLDEFFGRHGPPQ